MTVFHTNHTLSRSASNFGHVEYKLVRIKSLYRMEKDGWKLDPSGNKLVHPNEPSIYILETLIKKLGYRTEVYKSALGWTDSTGYTWPIEFIIFDDNDSYFKSGCECGAKYTSFPNHHLSFCREYKAP